MCGRTIKTAVHLSLQMPTGLLASTQPAAASELSYIQPQLQSGAYVPYQNRSLTQTLTQAAQRNNAQFAAVAAAATRAAPDPFQQSLCMSASLVLPRHSLQGKQREVPAIYAGSFHSPSRTGNWQTLTVAGHGNAKQCCSELAFLLGDSHGRFTGLHFVSPNAVSLHLFACSVSIHVHFR